MGAIRSPVMLYAEGVPVAPQLDFFARSFTLRASKRPQPIGGATAAAALFFYSNIR